MGLKMKRLITVFFVIALMAQVSLQASWATEQHHWLKNSLDAFPEDKKEYSPAVGVALNKGTLGKKIYKEQSSRGQLARNFLHILDGNLRQTALPSSPFSSIDAKTLGGLVSYLLQQKSSDDFVKSNEGKEWHAIHAEKGFGLSKEGDFKRKVRKILEPLKTMKAQDRAYVFSMLAAAQSNNEKDFEEYAQALGVSLDSEKFSDQELKTSQENLSFDGAQMIAKILENKLDPISHLVAQEQLYADYEGEKKIPICAEQSVWSIVNLILFNPETKKLDRALLPDTVNLLPAFKDFIKKSDQFKSKGLESQELINEFMQLVSNISGVKYSRAKFELQSDAETSLKVLNYLFGTKAQTLAEWGIELSTDRRSLTFENDSKSKYPEVIFALIDKNDEHFSIKAVWRFSKGHVTFELQNTTANNVLPPLKDIVSYQKEHPSIPLVQLALNELATVFFATPEELAKEGIDDKKAFEKEILALEAFDVENTFIRTGTLLEAAVREEKMNLIEALLAKGIDGSKILSIAIEEDKALVLKGLLDKGMTVNEENIAKALRRKGKSKEVIALLLQKGAEEEREIHNAIKKDDFENFKALIEAKELSNEYLKHSIAYAVFYNRWDMIDYLLSHKKGIIDDAMKYAVFLQNEEAIKYLFGKKANLIRAIDSAIQREDEVVVKILLDKSHLNPAQEQTLLMRAFMIEENEEMVKFLVENGVNPNGILPVAVNKGEKSIIELLLKHGADPNNALLSLFSNKERDIIELFLDYGLDAQELLKEADKKQDIEVRQIVQNYRTQHA